jgi:DNA-directed RNA polymerase subunit M/transcription elongation factor TFIIS
MKKEEENSFFEFLSDIFSLFKTKVIKKLSPEQITLLAADVEVVNERCKEIAHVHYEREEKWQESHDNTCPNCSAKKGEIVNKIRQVQGGGSVDGSFSSGLFYGSGSVHGSMKIDTFGVNHCNNCGNEWKKYNKDFKSTREVAEDGIKYVSRLIQDPVEYKWAKDLVKVFEGCYVETILQFAEKNQYSLYSDDKETLCFTKLHDYYKSVWDDPNIKREFKPLYINA